MWNSCKAWTHDMNRSVSIYIQSIYLILILLSKNQIIFAVFSIYQMDFGSLAENCFISIFASGVFSLCHEACGIALAVRRLPRIH